MRGDCINADLQRDPTETLSFCLYVPETLLWPDKKAYCNPLCGTTNAFLQAQLSTQQELNFRTEKYMENTHTGKPKNICQFTGQAARTPVL